MAGTDVLIERARDLTGLGDFGPDGWREGLEHLVAAVASDIGDPESVAAVEELVVARLAKRLRVQNWWVEHQGEMGQGVDGPLVIVGLPRTGTTALHHLLAVDRQFRYARKWELDDPIPPPEHSTEEQDPRRPVSPPRPDVQHVTSVDGPTEDRRIHELAFNDNEGVLPVPSFTRWWRTSDHRPAMVFHERVLRILHSRRPPHRWLLKDPLYLFQLAEFSAQYPKAKFVMTHRDPVAVLPSTCSVIVTLRRLRLPNWRSDPEELGKEALEFFPDGVRQAVAARDALGGAGFLDVGQHELERDPVGTAERVYEFAGLRLSDDTRAAMAAWATANEKGARGEHRYEPEDYGLTRQSIRSAFADYLDRYSAYCPPRD
jgi:hypothetical protein